MIVVGGGHAGCEAALAAARLGARTMLLTLSLDKIAWQPCNPAVGGAAKSQLVHEVDAMGGWIGKLADRTYVQKRILNASKVRTCSRCRDGWPAGRQSAASAGHGACLGHLGPPPRAAALRRLAVQIRTFAGFCINLSLISCSACWRTSFACLVA